MLQKIFGFDPHTMSIKTEIAAGFTAFLTMAYILAVHPAMLAATGMDKGALFTTTAVSSAFVTLLVAVVAKLPLSFAPGMGMNAMFAYTVCLTMGYSWQFALMAVFLEGIIFLLLTVFNLWDKIVGAIPDTLKTAITSGIGLFIIFVGLKNAGVIVGDDSTVVRMGDLTGGSPLLAMLGIVLTAVLYIKKVPGALLLGILLTALLGIPMGVTHLEGVLSTPPSMAPIFFQMDWSQIFTVDMLIVVLSLLFVDLFGIVGTIIGLGAQIAEDVGVKTQSLHRLFGIESVAVMSGAMMGTSAVVPFIESATGVKAGGRSGLTAMVTALFFLLALFLAPFFLSIPSAATTPVLVMVGLMMMSNLVQIHFSDFLEAVPAVLCMVIMPLSFSIADGIIIGQLSYVLIHLLCGKTKQLTVGMYILSLLFLGRFFL